MSVAYFTTFIGLPFDVKNGIVGSLDPDFPSALAESFVFSGLILAAIQLRPEFSIIPATSVDIVYEHAVMLALNLIERVADCIQEVVVRPENGSVHTEFDHRL